MGKIYSALGLMSGTSMDGVDASIIQSDGDSNYNVISNKYFEYNKDLFRKLTILRDKIYSSKDLIKMSSDIGSLEKEITLFHAEISNKMIEKSVIAIDFIGFHGQTIFHNVKEKLTKQLGDPNLLSQLTKKKVIYNFRENDLKNGGDGAPLTPIYHKLLVELLVKEKKVTTPVAILNIGGIANITSISKIFKLASSDIGPGNCIIDKWIRTNSNKNFDHNGDIAKSGKIDKFILDQTLDNFYNNKISKKRSLDINDFDINFVRGLSFENGAATITEFTAEIISKKISDIGINIDIDIYVCGGGRKNDFLINSIQNKIPNKIKKVDDFGVDGGFIESQAFGYLAIRSFLKLPISFPETTGCKEQNSGGVLIQNY
jgi:anhydro-N-acetylmuramic acid kinase